MSVSLCTGAGDGGTQDMAVGRDQDASSTRGNHTEYRKTWMGRERDAGPPEDLFGRRLGQAHVFENLIENLPARAARKKIQRFACLRAASEKIYECVRSAHT